MENDENIIFAVYINIIIYFNSEILRILILEGDLTSTVTNA